MFSIKICGIASVKDAHLATLAGADAVGFNFFSDSSRYISPDAAEAVVKVVGQRASKVGIFVNEPAAAIRQTTEQLGLDYIQLHGDEPPELIAELDGMSVIRALRLGTGGAADVLDYVEQCRASGSLAAVLVDASVAGEYGGTGQQIDFATAAEVRAALTDIPFVLAGGITPFNVEEAIQTVKPDGVDVASGVESAEAAKDPLLVRAFVTSAKKAFAGLEPSE